MTQRRMTNECFDDRVSRHVRSKGVSGLEPMLEGMSALSHDGDPVHASKRIEIHEMMD